MSIYATLGVLSSGGEAEGATYISSFLLWVLRVEGVAEAVNIPAGDEFHYGGAAGAWALRELPGFPCHDTRETVDVACVRQVFAGSCVSWNNDW